MRQYPNTISCALYFFAIIACWSILTIELQVIPLIKFPLTEKDIENINRVVVNLSYSYLAGWIFYLFTVVFPHESKKRKREPFVRRRIEDIIKKLENILLEFSSGTSLNHRDFTESTCKAILNSKSWTDSIDSFYEMRKINISYVKYIATTSDIIEREINNTIDLYCDFLSDNQIAALEELQKKEIWRTAIMFSNINANLDHPDGKNDLIADFYDAIKTVIKIERLFNITSKHN